MKSLKILSFGLTGVLVLFMMIATVLEKCYGTTFVQQHFYGSLLFAAGWGVMALSAVVYLCRCRVQKQFMTFALHLSFIVILAGALVTRLFGVQGSVHLREETDAPVSSFTATDGEVKRFPFSLSLSDFSLEYYPGTSAPMDFISKLLVKDGDGVCEGEVSMNRIYSYRHYRFYQAKYDMDGKGTTLSVAYDPWGIALTYTGYVLLLFSLCLFFFGRNSRFRRLLRHPFLKPAICLFFLLSAANVQASVTMPRTLSRETAARFGDLYVYYNDRVCPLQTLARDFTIKLCGKSSYKGLSAEQVLTGWFFYYDSWKEEPCIRIKNLDVRRQLGISGQYARLIDFIGRKGYKLDVGMGAGSEVHDRRALEEANEKFSLVSMVAAGSLWRIFPFVVHQDSLGNSGCVSWYSLADRLPHEMPDEQMKFVRGSMNYVAEQVARNDFQQVDRLLDKIRTYQEREAGIFLPSPVRMQAEKWYNQVNDSRSLAIASLVLGFFAFVVYVRSMVTRKSVLSVVSNLLLGGLILLSAYLCFVITLRGIIGGHVPMSNGHETMLLLAVCAVFLSFLFYRRFPIAIGFGYLLCGLALLVSMLGESNPQVTQLMPVLQSPLLSIHVVVIMVAYVLLAFVMLNGLTAIILSCSQRDCYEETVKLQLISNLLLYPAVFLLAIGIFIGAVWANISWGRYWGWDPKEVWALITLLIYALALHAVSLPWFRRTMFFHVFSVLAFFCVLITYFGVNFLLGGMHSYA